MSFIPDQASSNNIDLDFILVQGARPSAPAASQRLNEDNNSALDPQTTQGTVEFGSVSGNEVVPDL